MDVGLGSMETPGMRPSPAWRPRGCDRIGLVLQGGGALGAYQAGVYQAMHEAGLEPDWVAGVSIGGINAALIAGNPPERRLEALRDFWETVTARRVWTFAGGGDDLHKAGNAWSSWLTALLGIPGFFSPNVPNPWLTPRGARNATSFYDSGPLRETLLRLVDFGRINRGDMRFACGAVAISDGNFAYFDNRHVAIGPEHVMASGALPPAMPMVRVGAECYWDGGLVSNTPLQHVLDNAGAHNMLLFQVDLFSARGAVPRDMYDVLARQKDIQNSSRTRLVTDYYRRIHGLRTALRQALDKVPEAALTDAERATRAELATLPEITILQLIYQQAAYEGDAKDYEFSATSMREHWLSGYRDAANTLRRTEWLEMGRAAGGITVHDVHRTPE